MPNNTLDVAITLFVPSSWQTLNRRMAGFWTAASNTDANINLDYGIIEFQGAITSDLQGPGYYSNGGHPGFYGWNNSTNSWDLLLGWTPSTPDSWVQLEIKLVPGVGFRYIVAVGNLGVEGPSPLGDTTDNALTAALLQGYNYGVDYNIFWGGSPYSRDLNLESASWWFWYVA